MVLFKKVRRRGVVRAEKGVSLVISNKDIDDIIRTIQSLENSGVLIDEVSETVKHEIKWQEGRFLGILLGTSFASILGNMLTLKGAIRAVNEVVRAGTRYNAMDHMDKMF